MGRLFETWTNEIKKHYEFTKFLGKGGFGHVYLARHLDDKSLHACKVVEKTEMKPVALELLQEEVAFLKKLQHRCIVQFIEGFETRKKVYLIMELCSGGELLTRLFQKHRFDEETTSIYCEQMLDALQYVHAKNISHCDLKPENVMLKNNHSNQIRLIDFGLSKQRDKHQFLMKVSGTPSYIAPECLNHRFTEMCDLWAVGVMTFEFLFGFLPFRVRTSSKAPLNVIKKAAEGFQCIVKKGAGPWFPTSIPVSEEAKDFIGKLLKINPADRMTAREAIDHPFITRENKNDQKKEIHRKSELFGGLVVDSREDNHDHHRLNCIAKVLRIHSGGFDSFLKSDIYKTLLRHFQTADTDGNGLLDWEEFETCIRKSCDEITSDALKKLFDSMDINHEGEINISEFLATCAWNFTQRSDDRMLELLKQVDLDGDGQITFHELTAMVEHQQIDVSPRTLRNLRDHIEKNGGALSYDEVFGVVSQSFSESVSIEINKTITKDLQDAK